MFAMWLLIIIFAIALFAPLIVSVLGLSPFDFDNSALDPATGSLPRGPWGGISLDHPLGVEPLTGRDIMARLLYGARISLFISFTSVFFIGVIGTSHGHPWRGTSRGGSTRSSAAPPTCCSPSRRSSC